MYLGIDVGTSGVKGVLTDEGGAVVASHTEGLDMQTPRPGWCEQHPDAWWDAVGATVAALHAADRRTGEVRALGLSGQMHGAVCLDADDRPLRPAILWNDTRSHAEADRLAEVPGIEEECGVRPMPGFTATKLMWLAAHEPQVHGAIARVVTPKDHVRLRLTGEAAMEMSDAGGTCWLDQRAREWSPRLCEASDTDPAWLPPLLEGTAPAGRLTAGAAETLGLARGTPVAAGGGDAAAGAVGIGAVAPGDAFISLGTSGQLFAVTQGYRAAPGTLVHAFAHCLPPDTGGGWFHMAALLNGASPLAWWARACGAEVGTLLAEAEERDATSVLFLPYLTGERTPLNDSHIRGAFYGLAHDTDRAGMTRAVLEGVAYSCALARDAMASAGTELARVGAIGGGARSDLFLQVIADALDVTIERYAGAEAGAALGAARLAMMADGASVADVALKPEVESVFEPRAAEGERHGARRARFRRLYEALKPEAEGLMEW